MIVLAMTKEERLFLWVGILVGVLLFGAVVIARIDRWRKRQMADADEGPRQLGTFREMYERGELTKAEYDRCLRRVAERSGLQAKATPPTPPPPDEPTQGLDAPPTTDDRDPT